MWEASNSDTVESEHGHDESTVFMRGHCPGKTPVLLKCLVGIYQSMWQK